MADITLMHQIEELYHQSTRTYNIRENDAVSVRTFKLMFLGYVYKTLGLDWSYIVNLFKLHTPLHPEMQRELQCDEEVNNILAQVFVRNDKLVRLLKVFSHHGKNMNKMLAVDGLGGNSNGVSFDQKHYVGNLRYGSKGEPLNSFDNDPEYKRRHVQTVREMYDMLKDVPAPEKQIYQILRYSFMELGKSKVSFPEIEFEPEEEMDKKLQGEVGQYYMQTMGEENIQNLIKSKRFRGEKRTLPEKEEERESA